MSFEKNYPKSKDARKRAKKYHGPREHDPSCRSHGGCPACRTSRARKVEKKLPTPEAY
jgi:hypothetical protein